MKTHKTRKVLIGLVVIALLVPMFAAFEAHVINVKAHIENALQVEPREIDFGVVFPQEEFKTEFNVGLSESFMAQDRVNDVHYKLVQRRKPKTTYDSLDVVLAFDLTGSMGDELAAVKANAGAIIEGFKTVSDDLQVGVMSIVDYPGYYDYTAECGYAAYYGYPPDYAYKLDTGLTSDTDAAMGIVNAMVTYNGMDGPQDYARVAFESWADPGIGWRAGSKKVVILFGDNVPHDCDLGTGGDPGRDEIKGTADDLDWDTELANMAWMGIELNTVHSGWNLAEWTEWTGRTGGMAVDAAEYDHIVDAIADLYAYADLRPYVTKTKVADDDLVEDVEEAAMLDKSVGDLSDTWLIDFYVPCIEGSVGRDYVGAIAPKEDDYGLDIWVEVYGLSYADGTTWPADL